MQKDDNPHYYRVICSSGDSFYTSARTASEFVLDPVFVQFTALSVLLCTPLMMALDLPFVPQVILFGAAIISTFFWLTICIRIYLNLINPWGLRTVYTPLLLLPTLVVDTLIKEYILRIFDTSNIERYDGLWEVGVRTVIIIVCLDIFHAKFVAPQHKLTLRIDKDGTIATPTAKPVDPPGTIARASATEAVPHHKQPAPNEDHVTENAVQTVTDQGFEHDPFQPKLEHELRIGRETFDLADTLYIRSEGHYLVVQGSSRQKMVRGRLREVAAQIDPSLGMQINRSAWIAYAAISSVNKNPMGQLETELRNGSTIKVANSRKSLFEHGFNQYAVGNTTSGNLNPQE